MKFNITAKKVFLSLVMAAALLSAGLSAAAPAPALAAAQGCTNSGGSGGTSSPGQGLSDLGDKSQGITCAGVDISSKRGVAGVVARLIDWALYISGAIAVIWVIYGGYRYMMSSGSEETATEGRRTVTNALIGLIIIILAYVIVNAVANLITSP